MTSDVVMIKCPRCLQELVSDSFDKRFNTCFYEFLYCERCPVICVLSVRFGRPFRAYWLDCSNDTENAWVQTFTD